MLAIFNMLGGPEFVIILIVGLILFGGRLPDVGKSVGKTLIEFRKGLRDLKKDIGLDEVSDLRRDLGQLTQAHYNILDVPDEELEDRQEGKENLGAENPELEGDDNDDGEAGLADEDLGEEHLETESSRQGLGSGAVEGAREGVQGPPGTPRKKEPGLEEGPFAREDAELEELDKLGLPFPGSENKRGDTEDPPQFGYRT